MSERAGSIAWLRAVSEWERTRSDRPSSLAAARSVASELFLAADADGGNCYPGARAVASSAGVHKDTVTAFRRRWREHGWLIDTGGRAFGGAVIYRLSIPGSIDQVSLEEGQLGDSGVPSTRDSSQKVSLHKGQQVSPKVSLEEGQLAKGVPLGVPLGVPSPRDEPTTDNRALSAGGSLSGANGSEIQGSLVGIDAPQSGSANPGATAAPRGAGLPGEEKLGKPKRRTLHRHLAAARELWDRQEQLRAEVRQELGSSGRRLKPTAERLVRVAERLEAGSDTADAEHVLQVYASEARAKRSMQWFNGETNWRPDNFDRALGKELEGPAEREGALGHEWRTV